ncbi:MAG TPA: 5-(carboxyamino)imidazole ribonucleotide mutase [Candidatus Dormibacteraeota bacterium]|jgi:5-(carboxyamino)imidazole ribonucleotide mutase|nr:5-(carboxyamino)imidazole ribonucleotide mutase [Candidatus Dormibacteraeota bacterium]
MSGAQPRVGIVMGSESDEAAMRRCAEVLDDYGIAHETAVISAHRAPEMLHRYAASARDRGLRVLVAGAGAAAALPGVLAGLTTLPVIGVPLAGTPLSGFDALLSIVQMPPGIPVATVAVGEMGARNAGHLAARILALSDPAIAEATERVRDRMRERVRLPEGFDPGD